jgi:Xaa-Pro aminopeptidase
MSFSRSEFLRRNRLVEQEMSQTGLDVLIAYSVKNDPGSVVYLSGFESSLGLHDVAFFVIVPGSKPTHTLLTNAFWDHPAERTWVEDVIITNSFGARLPEFVPRSARRIGIAGFNFFPAPVFTALQAALPQAEFVDATHMLMEVAIVKSEEEVEAVRRCVEMTDAGGHAFLENVRAGVNEREVKAEVERAIMRAGSDAYWYNFQLFAGPQVAYGMGGMTGRTIGQGDQVQVDCGALHMGYRGDFSRVTTIGKPAPDVEKVMETTAEMYEAMLAAIRPGVAVADVANAAWAAAERRGMGEFYYRSPNPPSDKRGFVGHGMGCWTHSLPSVEPDAQGVLEANTVLVFEPILSQIGVGGAKIEDSVLVTANGAERLSKIDIRSWRSPGNPDGKGT